jgi:hypothetical protein
MMIQYVPLSFSFAFVCELIYCLFCCIAGSKSGENRRIPHHKQQEVVIYLALYHHRRIVSHYIEMGT